MFNVATALGLVLVFAASSVAAQAPAQPPLPDTHMRAPTSVPVGLAPKMRVVESSGPAHVFEAYFSAGDELVSGLTDLALANGIESGYLTGLGGLSGALLAWGDPTVGGFRKIPIDEKCELISLTGHIQLRDGKPVVHMHAVVGFGDGSTKAGHVFEARVAPLAEISVVATKLPAR